MIYLRIFRFLFLEADTLLNYVILELCPMGQVLCRYVLLYASLLYGSVGLVPLSGWKDKQVTFRLIYILYAQIACLPNILVSDLLKL